MIVFERIAAVLVAAWFLAGGWLVVQALRLPGRTPPAGKAAGD